MKRSKEYGVRGASGKKDKYIAAFMVGASLAIVSLIHWSSVARISFTQVFAALVVYVASSLLITWAISDTIKMIRRDFLKK